MGVNAKISRLLFCATRQESAFFLRGVAAAQAGLSIHDNPYSSPVDHHHGGRSINEWNEDQWRRGWLSGSNYDEPLDSRET